MDKYGRDEATWDELTEAGLGFLIECARRPGPVSYTELNHALVDRTGFSGFDFSRPDERGAVGYLLGRIVERTYPQTGLMLSALVTHQGGTDPGSGFYKLATEIKLLRPGASEAERDAFWIAQFKRVQQYYAGAGRSESY
ncbi:hypothetical protein [Microbispora rosea]|uniref:hypothetical protein n=1 Tax=Microbispora rosea TaxID=58117 RepID=UPI00341646C1